MLRSLRRGRLVFPLTRAGRSDAPRQSQDFIGLNYYTRELVKFNHRYRAELFGERTLPAHALRSDLNWELYPEGLYRTLRSLGREQLPIYVPQDGIADGRAALPLESSLTHLNALLRPTHPRAPPPRYFPST